MKIVLIMGGVMGFGKEFVKFYVKDYNVILVGCN